MLLLILSALQQAPAQPTPRRVVPDSGIVVTNPQVTPAGVQSAFDGRVTGVRFGAPGEIWVAVPGSAFHLSWADNRVIARGALPGRSGTYGVAIDPVTSNAIVTSIGRVKDTSAILRTPGSEPRLSKDNLTQVFAFPSKAGTPIAPIFSTAAFGDFMAGAPSIAQRAGPDGHRLMVVPLPANDALSVLDAETGVPVRVIPLGVEPLAAALSADGSIAYVTVLGGPKPNATQRLARQCCDPRVEMVRVDSAGIAERGTVVRVDVRKGAVLSEHVVGRQPTGLTWDEARARVYVTNANSDDVSIVDTRADSVVSTLPIVPFRGQKIGLAPMAVAVAPDGKSLFVALAGVNAVAVYDISDPAKQTLRGLIPTGWYPTALDVSADGKHLAVGALLGVGSGEGRVEGRPGKQVHANRGSVNIIDIPTTQQLAAYTTAVAQNNRMPLMSSGPEPVLASQRSVVAQPIPERPGEPSPIRHVVYIIRENRTFDQVFGDIGKGASDPRMLVFGKDVTPNAHALANQFVLLDHFFALGGNSGDGHNWVTQANETPYAVYPLYYGRSYTSHSDDPEAYSSGGFIWQAAQEQGKRVAVFGEYSAEDITSGCKNANRNALLAEWRDSIALGHAHFHKRLTKLCNTRSDIPSLDKALVREFPNWDMNIPDVVRAEDFLSHLDEWTRTGEMPALSILQLPSDHTWGMRPGSSTPKATVADNDLALGKVVEGLSHSPFWKSMAIFVVEDDAQAGVDHIDGHRTVALAISPYTRRGAVDSTFYNQTSMTKSIELILDLPALSIYDLISTDMRASFIGANEQPNLTPFTAVNTAASLLHDVAPRVGDIRGPNAAARRAAALASAKMNFDVPDAAPTETLNKILWHDARGWKTPWPGVKQSLFFPLAVDLADDEREEREEQEHVRDRVRRVQPPVKP